MAMFSRWINNSPSLRGVLLRILTLIVLLLVIAWGTFLILFWLTTKEEAESQIESEASRLLLPRGINEIADLIKADVMLALAEQGQSLTKALINPDGGCGVTFSGSLSICPVWSIEDPGSILFADDGWGWYETSSDTGSKVRFLAHRYPVPDSGGYQLIVGRSFASYDAFFQVAGGAAVASCLCVFFGGLGAGLLMTRAMVAKVSEINAFCETYHYRFTQAGARIQRSFGIAEVDRIAENINRLIDRVEMAMASLHDFSAQVAHDMRTPLARLRVRIAAIEARESSDVSLAQADSLAEIDALLGTFEALLRIARIEATQDHDKKEVDLSGLLDEVMGLAEALAEEKNIVISKKIAPLVVHGDEALLKQMIWNLLDNAIKYSPPGTTVEVTLRQERGQFRLQIADHGPGIPPELRQRVFQRFFRISEISKAAGTGLGLALVAAIAKRYAIEIRLADNQPGLIVDLAFPAIVGNWPSAGLVR